MIFINDEKANEYPEQFKFYQEKLASIKRRDHIPKNQKEYIFIDPKPIRLGDKGKAEPKQQIVFPSKSSFMGVSWIYCLNSWVDKQGNRAYSPKDILFKSKERLNPDISEQADKIFFYMYVNKTIQGRLKLQNLEKEIREKNLISNDRITTEFLIKTTHSPISVESTGNEDLIRKISKSWYISEVDKIPIEQLKEKLLKKIDESEKNKSITNRGYAEFVKESYNLPLIELKVSIQTAIDLGVIEYYNLQWIYKNTTKVICQISNQMNKEPKLALEDYLNNDIDALNDFKEAISLYRYNENRTYFSSTNNNKVSVISPNPESIRSHIPEELRKITKDHIEKSERDGGYKFYEKKVIAKKLGLKVSSSTNQRELNKILIDTLEL
jgi:hypothetical protein